MPCPRAYHKAEAIAPDAILVVDTAPFLAGQIGETVREVGFLYILGHGVLQSLIDGTVADRSVFS
jgi:hypothetical protein